MRGHRVVPLIHKNSASGRRDDDARGCVQRQSLQTETSRRVALDGVMVMPVVFITRSVEERALERDVVELREGEIGRAHGERHVAREVIGHERRVSVDDERLEKGDEPWSLGGDDERLLAKRSTRRRRFGDSRVWVL